MKTTHSIKEYVEKNQQRLNAHWRYADGLQFRDKDGIWRSEKLFWKYYPKYQYVKFNPKGDNPNKKSIY